MGTISVEHSDRLYWLGRYTERTFTTLKALQKIIDGMIDQKLAYTDYLAYFDLPDVYSDNMDFVRSFLYDKKNMNSVAHNIRRSYDNGIVLREEISTDSLSFLQMAKDTLDKAGASENVMLSLLPLEDILYAFWGSVNEHIYDDEIRNIIYIGKTLERLDLYIRMGYPFGIVEKESIRLMKNLHRVPKISPYRYNTQYLSDLVEVLGTEEDYKKHPGKALESLNHLFEREEKRA
ncbi:MAG: alpha-E domain-containing protein [Oscillospiraceae bacterium]|nr:alpha-E domain-containing protein [Oscillospiraceae bacterium]